MEETKEANEPEEAVEPGWFDRVVMDPLDDLQRRFTPVAFVVALFKRFSEDRGGPFSALLAYYGFFSLLAILLVLGTVSATLLADNPDLQNRLVNSITSSLPVTGDTVATNVQKLNGSGAALLIGVLFVTWSGLGVVNNAQDAFNTMWNVPRFQWPNIWLRTARSAAILLVVGGALVVLTAGGPLLSSLDLGWFGWLVSVIGATAINAFALLICFKLLTSQKIALRTMLPGAVGGAVALAVLQFAGTWYLTRVVQRAGAFYGTFAATIGLLVWIGLQARIILMASEINVVWSKVLWPRSLTGRRLGPADERALSDLVAREAMSEHITVDTSYAAVGLAPTVDEEPSGQAPEDDQAPATG